MFCCFALCDVVSVVLYCTVIVWLNSEFWGIDVREVVYMVLYMVWDIVWVVMSVVCMWGVEGADGGPQCSSFVGVSPYKC